MADVSTNRMNLAAIKRVDPYAKDIVDSTAHVAFYTFNSDENEWEKTDVEGAFFIYSRNAEPFNSIFINNRLNTTSFVEPITGQLEIQSQAPFLLYRNERSRIRGFWFYNSSECDRIGDLVCSLIQDCVVKQKTSGNAINNSVNIFNMLSRAQQDFQSGLNTTAVSTTNQPDLGSRNVMNFFAAAKPTPSADLPLFRRMLSNTLSVEQLEKQQVKAPLNDSLNQLPKLDPELAKLSLTKQKTEQPKCDLEMSPLAKFLNIQNILKPTTATSLKKESELPRDVCHKVEQQQNPPKPALMLPTMFEKSLKTSENTVDQYQQHQQQGVVFNNSIKPLTQSQLVKTICYLIKNDSEFVRKIHEAYVKQFSEISNDFMDD